jgi:hypothetical protein
VEENPNSWTLVLLATGDWLQRVDGAVPLPVAGVDIKESCLVQPREDAEDGRPLQTVQVF